MKKNKGLLSIVGFLLLAFGFLSLLLGLLGMRFSFLSWIDALGMMGSFVFKLMMLIVGFGMLYLGSVDVDD